MFVYKLTKLFICIYISVFQQQHLQQHSDEVNVISECWLTAPYVVIWLSNHHTAWVSGYFRNRCYGAHTNSLYKVFSLDVSQFSSFRDRPSASSFYYCYYCVFKRRLHVKECRSSQFLSAPSPSDHRLGAMLRFAPSSERSAWCGRLGPGGRRPAAGSGPAAAPRPGSPRSARSVQRRQRREAGMVETVSAVRRCWGPRPQEPRWEGEGTWWWAVYQHCCETQTHFIVICEYIFRGHQHVDVVVRLWKWSSVLSNVSVSYNFRTGEVKFNTRKVTNPL